MCLFDLVGSLFVSWQVCLFVVFIVVVFSLFVVVLFVCLLLVVFGVFLCVFFGGESELYLCDLLVRFLFLGKCMCVVVLLSLLLFGGTCVCRWGGGGIQDVKHNN